MVPLFMFKTSLQRPLRLARFRAYHSFDHPASNLIINPAKLENKILTKSLEYVPEFGFDEKCVTRAIKDLKFADSVQSVLTSSYNGHSLELQLVLHWLKSKRQDLQAEIADKTSEFHSVANEYDRVAWLINKRLSYNVPVIGKLSGGIAQLIVPYNLSSSLEELHNLGDDIAYYAGDKSNDFAWYAKRLSISSAYVSSELFMLQDSSLDYSKTKEFVNDKVRNIDHLGEMYQDVEQWTFFNAIGVMNLVKSQLVRG